MLFHFISLYTPDSVLNMLVKGILKKKGNAKNYDDFPS